MRWHKMSESWQKLKNNTALIYSNFDYNGIWRRVWLSTDNVWSTLNSQHVYNMYVSYRPGPSISHCTQTDTKKKHKRSRVDSRTAGLVHLGCCTSDEVWSIITYMNMAYTVRAHVHVHMVQMNQLDGRGHLRSHHSEGPHDNNKYKKAKWTAYAKEYVQNITKWTCRNNVVQNQNKHKNTPQKRYQNGFTAHESIWYFFGSKSLNPSTRWSSSGSQTLSLWGKELCHQLMIWDKYRSHRFPF